MLAGYECWNRADAGTEEEWARVRALRCSVLKLRADHPTEVVDRALEINPHMRFLLRRVRDGKLNPRQQVAEARRLIEYIDGKGIWLAYIGDNEPDLPSTAQEYADPEDYADHLWQLYAALRINYPDLPLCSPPMAVMVETERWLEAIEPVSLQWQIEYRGAHAYWQDGNWIAIGWGKSLDAYQSICPGARWIVDEVAHVPDGSDDATRATTTLAVLDWLRRRGDVEAATVFIAGGTDDWRGFWLPVFECGMIGAALAETGAGGGTTVVSVGEGFQKAIPYAGEFTESEIYHGDEETKTSLAIETGGYASWRRATNQTVVVCDDGRILADRGNHGDGSLVEVCGPFPG